MTTLARRVLGALSATCPVGAKAQAQAQAQAQLQAQAPSSSSSLMRADTFQLCYTDYLTTLLIAITMTVDHMSASHIDVLRRRGRTTQFAVYRLDWTGLEAKKVKRPGCLPAYAW